MSVNKHKEHILVIPEDDANRQIINGFLKYSKINADRVQVLTPAGGWKKVCSSFENNQISKMVKFNKRIILLVIDFDNDYKDRLEKIENMIPNNLKNRVFVIGVSSEPEDLKKRLNKSPKVVDKSNETIGKELAEDCVNGTDYMWGHDFLKHNQGKLDRMIKVVKPFLFNNC